MKPLAQILAVILFAHTVAFDASAANVRFAFNGSDLQMTNRNGMSVEFKSKLDPGFVETVLLRRVENSPDFSAAARDMVKRAKLESNEAKLKLLDRPGRDEIIVIYLADAPSGNVVYKAERLSGASKSGIISISYKAEFEAGNIDDNQTDKIKRTAVDALAKFDMQSALPLLEPIR